MKISSKLKVKINKLTFSVRKKSPEILLFAGIGGVVVATVKACKATTKVSEILDETKDNAEQVHNCIEGIIDIEPGSYTNDDAKKDLAIIYTKACLGIAKLYAPSVIIGVLSIGGILASHNILRKRNIALAAAYQVVDSGFKDYRKRVIDRFGEEVDKQLKYNIKEEIQKKTVTDENGNEKTVEETIKTCDGFKPSAFAKFFDESNPNWEKSADYNLNFLLAQQNYANNKLQAQGYLFLNDVYDMLGIPRTKVGQVFGWIYDTENPIGDNYIDFNIYDNNNEAGRLFVNGLERSILLDFNVDGYILDSGFDKSL